MDNKDKFKFFVADGHCDTVSLFLRSRESYDFARLNRTGHIDLPRLRLGGVALQCFAVCLEPAFKPWGALRRTLVLFGHFHRVLEENKESIMLVIGSGTLREALESGKVAALLTVEGGESLEGELEVLRSLYRLGARGLGLTWNDRNDLADGVGVGNAAGGLTDFGREVVSEMNRLGMMVDAAHLSRRSFFDVLEHSTSPVVVTHANAYAICPHRRNLDDEQLRALRDQGGVIGMSFYPPFVHQSGQAGLEQLLDHYCYVAARFGVAVLAVGSDFDGIDRSVDGLNDASYLPVLGEGLQKRGFSALETQQIMGGNFLRVLDKILKTET